MVQGQSPGQNSEVLRTKYLLDFCLNESGFLSKLLKISNCKCTLICYEFLVIIATIVFF